MTIPKDWGITNLVPIPKVPHLDMITHFRPISLCNTLYKLVSRIILQRLKPYIANIINPCQVRFIPGHQTSDNIILVQEIIHTLVRKGGKRGHIALKLDLDKTYDKLEWSFIQESLEFFQVPPTSIKLIKNMLSSTRYHIQWNGSLLPKVVPVRGVC